MVILRLAIGNIPVPVSFLAFLFGQFVLIVLPVDFIGVGVTRRFIKWLKGGITLTGTVCVFLFEVTVKAVVIPIMFYAISFAEHVRPESADVDTNITITEHMVIFVLLYLLFGGISNILC